MRKRKAAQRSGGSAAWMATFSDLLMLMLTFFVLLLSMSSLDEQRLRELTREGLSDEYNPQKNSIAPGQEFLVLERLEVLLEEGVTRGELMEKEQVRALLQELLEEAGLRQGSWVEVRPEGLKIEIDGRLSFAPGSRELTPELRRFLGPISELLRRIEAQAMVTAYVEESGGSAEQEWEGWELALGRADGVVRFFLEGAVPPTRLQLMGYGRASGQREARWVRNANALELELLWGAPGSVRRRL